jgi:hypothetical protein
MTVKQVFAVFGIGTEATKVASGSIPKLVALQKRPEWAFLAEVYSKYAFHLPFKGWENVRGLRALGHDVSLTVTVLWDCGSKEQPDFDHNEREAENRLARWRSTEGREARLYRAPDGGYFATTVHYPWCSNCSVFHKDVGQLFSEELVLASSDANALAIFSEGLTALAATRRGWQGITPVKN